tara:strand:- start:117 stop:2609 length:2493 start_codon:yes stop_codon:yes gene_type:complete
MSISVIEARQKAENAQVTSNGDWSNILMERVVLETGDTMDLTFCSVDTTEEAKGTIFIDKDTPVEMNYIYYAQLDHVNIPFTATADILTTVNAVQSGGANGTVVDTDMLNGSNTVFTHVNPGNPTVHNDSPSPLCRWYKGASHHRRLDRIFFQYVDTNKPITTTTFQLEFKSPRYQVGGEILSTNRITLRIPGRPRLADGGVNGFSFSMAELGLPGGYVIYALPPSCVNQDHIAKHNLKFTPDRTEVVLVPDNIPVLIPIQRVFKTIVPAGKYSPDDLAQYITRAMSINDQTTLTRVNFSANPPTEPFGWGTQMLLGKEMLYTDNGTSHSNYDSQFGSHFYSNFSNFNGWRQTEPLTSTAAFDLYDFFVYNTAGLQQVGESANQTREQCFSYMPPIGVYNSVMRRRSWDRQRNFGASQGPSLVFNDTSNKFEWSLMHSPYINMTPDKQGQMGFAYIPMLVPDLTQAIGVGGSTAGDSHPGLGGQQTSYPGGPLTNLGGIAWTCLHPIELFEDILGFDTYDCTVQISHATFVSPSDGSIEATSPDLAHNWGGFTSMRRAFTFAPGALTPSTAPLLPYICVGVDPRPIIQGQIGMRNQFSGKCFTDLFLAKADTTFYRSTDATADTPIGMADTSYIFNQSYFAWEWFGNWRDITLGGVDLGSTPKCIPGMIAGSDPSDPDSKAGPYYPPLEGTSTNLQTIRAKNFAQGSKLTSAYYLVEIDGISHSEFISADKISRVMAGLVNRYYSNGQYTAGAQSFQYTHQSDKPLIIDSLRIRILNPDGSLANTLGDDNTIMLELSKSQANVARSQINLMDAQTTKKQKKVIEGELKSV